MHTDRFTYRADIDGLRAIAVLSVVFCHAGLGFKGGFVGVDVFFVISGYLITSLIVRDIEANRFSMVDFWERRIRRIVPALLTVTVASSLAGWFLLTPIAYASFGKSVVGLCLMVSNLQFWRETGYFEMGAEEKPLLHTWSLAVEEQFYLVLPLLLLVIVRVRRWNRVDSLMGCAALLSFGLSVWGTRHASSATYYMLPMRAWELLAGALLALRPMRWLARSRRWSEVAAFLGIAGILIPCFLYDKETPFPGILALPPVLGAVLLIASGSGASRDPVVNRILASRPFVFVGLISYSLYLWHWPLLVFARYRSESEPGHLEKWLLVAAGLLLGTLTWRFVESPFRRRTFLASRRRLVATNAAAFGAVLASGLAIYCAGGFERRLPPQAIKITTTSQPDARFIHDLRASDIPDNMPRFGRSSGAAELLIWGDSHAMAVLPAIEALCRESGVSAVAATHAGTVPTVGYFSPQPYGLNVQSIPFNASVLDYVKSRKVDTVILTAYWSRYFKEAGLSEALLETIDQLQATGAKVYFMKDVPVYDFDVIKRMVRYSWCEWDLSGISMSLKDYESLNQFHESFLPKLQVRGVAVLDPVPHFLAKSRSHSVVPCDPGGSYYRDRGHLSTYGALVLKPLFAPMIERLTPTTRHAASPLLSLTP